MAQHIFSSSRGRSGAGRCGLWKARHADDGLLAIRPDCHDFSSLQKKWEQSSSPSPLSVEVKKNRPEGGNG